MAEWLSSSRKKKIGDIRSFIPVHGKILKPKSTSLNLESSSGVDCLVSDPHEAWPRTSGGKQLSLAQINKQDAAAKCTCQKVPASLVTTGIRRKTTRTAATNEKQDPEVFTGCGMEDKENFDTETSQVTTHTGLSASHRESHAQVKQQRSPTKKSTAILGKHKISDCQCWTLYSNQRHCDKLDECLTRGPHTAEGDGSCLGSSVGTSPQKCTRQAAQASESITNCSPPAKRLRPEHDYSSDRDSCRKVKIRCSQGRNPVRASTDWNERLGLHLADNEVKNIMQKHKQAHGTKLEVQTVGTTADSSTVHSSAESDTVTKPESAGANTSTLPVSNSPLGCISHADTSDGTTADVADTHLAPTRIEECSFFEPIPNSQGLFSFSASSNIDTDELLAELSNCEKMV